MNLSYVCSCGGKYTDCKILTYDTDCRGMYHLLPNTADYDTVLRRLA